MRNTGAVATVARLCSITLALAAVAALAAWAWYGDERLTRIALTLGAGAAVLWVLGD